MAKFKVTRKQYKLILNLYRLISFFGIVALLVLFSLLLDKLIEFCIMFTTYFISKNMYSVQYHTNSMQKCIIVSLFVFGLAIVVCINSTFSLLFSALFGISISFVSSYVGEINIKLKDYTRLREEELNRNSFNVATCTKEQLLARCNELKFNNRQIEFCIKAFVEQLPIKELAEYYYVEIQSIKNKKQIYKNKLNNTS